MTTFFVAAPCSSDAIVSVGQYCVGQDRAHFVAGTRKDLEEKLKGFSDEAQGQWPKFVVTVEVQPLPKAELCAYGDHSAVWYMGGQCTRCGNVD